MQGRFQNHGDIVVFASTNSKEDTMHVPWKTALRVVCSCALVLGVMSLLIESRSTGEAFETLKLNLLPGVLSTVAVGLTVLAILGFAAMFLWDHRGKTKEPWRHA